jgi:hypothetical protein
MSGLLLIIYITYYLSLYLLFILENYIYYIVDIFWIGELVRIAVQRGVYANNKISVVFGN